VRTVIPSGRDSNVVNLPDRPPYGQRWDAASKCLVQIAAIVLGTDDLLHSANTNMIWLTVCEPEKESDER